MTTHELIRRADERLKEGERFCELRCTTDNHYKSYMISMKQATDQGFGERYNVTCYWGPIGKGVQSQSKGYAVSKNRAEHLYNTWKAKKLRPHGTGTYVLHEEFTGVNTVVSHIALELDAIPEGQKPVFATDGQNTYLSYLEI